MHLVHRCIVLAGLFLFQSIAGVSKEGVRPDASWSDPPIIGVTPVSRYLDSKGTVTVVGYNDMKPMLESLGVQFSKVYPGVRFVFALEGTRTAPPALASGQSAFAPMGAEFSDEELKAYRCITGTDPVLFKIAHASLNPKALSGPLAIVVHEKNPLDSISLPQLKQVFSGEAKYWKDLGLGATGNRTLTPRGLYATTALGRFFRNRVMPSAQLATTFRGSPQSAHVVRHVAMDPDAIGFAAAQHAGLGSGVKILRLAKTAGGESIALDEKTLQSGQYPLDRFLLVYVRLPLDPLVHEYLRVALSPEGQRSVSEGQLGYLGLNDEELAVELLKLESTLGYAASPAPGFDAASACCESTIMSPGTAKPPGRGDEDECADRAARAVIERPLLTRRAGARAPSLACWGRTLEQFAAVAGLGAPLPGH